jgi:hypothetical protein
MRVVDWLRVNNCRASARGLHDRACPPPHRCPPSLSWTTRSAARSCAAFWKTISRC